MRYRRHDARETQDVAKDPKGESRFRAFCSWRRGALCTEKAMLCALDVHMSNYVTSPLATSSAIVTGVDMRCKDKIPRDPLRKHLRVELKATRFSIGVSSLCLLSFCSTNIIAFRIIWHISTTNVLCHTSILFYVCILLITHFNEK